MPRQMLLLAVSQFERGCSLLVQGVLAALVTMQVRGGGLLGTLLVPLAAGRGVWMCCCCLCCLWMRGSGDKPPHLITGIKGMRVTNNDLTLCLWMRGGSISSISN